MNLLKELQFEKCEIINHVQLNCNCCGRTFSRGWLKVIIHPFEIKNHHFDVVVCGDTCRSNLLKHPATENFLIDKITDIAKTFDLAIKKEYQDYFSFAYNNKN